MSNRPRGAAPLTLERIVTAAIELADDHGFDAVSMRRVAQHLGSGTMSLYRHVADKDELVAAMVDQVTAGHTYPDPQGMDWRERMHAIARTDWHMFVGHPWMLAATTRVAPPFGPESLAGMEWALDALEPLGLDPRGAATVIMAVNNYVQGSVRLVLGELAAGSGADDPARAWQRRLGDVDLERFPHLRRLVAQPRSDAEPHWFVDGLDVILDGAQRRAAAPQPGEEPPDGPRGVTSPDS